VGAGGWAPVSPKPHHNGQLPLFTEYLPHPAIHQLQELKLDALTPLQAFDALRTLKLLTDSKA
jgi:hypothetical protein